MNDPYSVETIARQRHQELMQEAARYRMVKQANLSQRRGLALPKIDRVLAAIGQKVGVQRAPHAAPSTC